MVWTTLGSQVGPIHRGQGDTEGKGQAFLTGRARGLNKYGNLPSGWSQAPQAESVSGLPARISKVYRGPKRVQPHFQGRYSAKPTSLQACFFRMAPTAGALATIYIPRMGEGWGGPIAQRQPPLRFTCQSRILQDFPANNQARPVASSSDF